MPLLVKGFDITAEPGELRRVSSQQQALVCREGCAGEAGAGFRILTAALLIASPD
jgi:hypothetical protein